MTGNIVAAVLGMILIGSCIASGLPGLIVAVGIIYAIHKFIGED